MISKTPPTRTHLTCCLLNSQFPTAGGRRCSSIVTIATLSEHKLLVSWKKRNTCILKTSQISALQKKSKFWVYSWGSIVTCYAWRVGAGRGAFRRILVSADLTDCIHKPCLSAFMMYVCINVLIYVGRLSFVHPGISTTCGTSQDRAKFKKVFESTLCVQEADCLRQFHRNIFSLSKVLKYFQPL